MSDKKDLTCNVCKWRRDGYHLGHPYSYCTWDKTHTISEIIYRKCNIKGSCRHGKQLGYGDEVGDE